MMKSLLLALSLVTYIRSQIFSSHECLDAEQGEGRTHCSFKNICFDPSNSGEHNQWECWNHKDDFHYYYPPHEQMPNIPNSSLTLFTSCSKFSVSPHANQLPSAVSRKIQWIEYPVFGHFRNHVMNYFHILMDDLMGLFWQIRHHNLHQSSRDFAVMIIDHKDLNTMGHSVYDFSSAFSQKPLMLLDNLPKDTLTCFREFNVGPATRGFGVPGHVLLDHDDVKRYSRFLLTNLNLFMIEPQKPKLVLIHRGKDRLVLNEDALVADLKSSFPQLQIHIESFEKMSLEQQVRLMRSTSILVGMHGAGMTNLLFLPRNAAVIELFPWHFTRPIYQSMSQSLGLSYMRWENDNKETTVFHESILQQFSHVPEDVKKEIRNANERPHWISGQGGLAAEKYWINQDTNVDIPAIRKLVERSLYNSALNSELLRKATGKDEL